MRPLQGTQRVPPGSSSYFPVSETRAQIRWDLMASGPGLKCPCLGVEEGPGGLKKERGSCGGWSLAEPRTGDLKPEREGSPAPQFLGHLFSPQVFVIAFTGLLPKGKTLLQPQPLLHRCAARILGAGRRPHATELAPRSASRLGILSQGPVSASFAGTCLNSPIEGFEF